MRFRLTDMNSGLLPRVVVNPNRATRKHPSWTVLGFEELDFTPGVGDRILAVQPDDDGDWTSSAVITEVDLVNQLAYADVDWDSFGPEISARFANEPSHYAVRRSAIPRSAPVHFDTLFTPQAA